MVRHSSLRSGFPVGNPIANVLVIIAGALVVGASIVVGFFAFLALAAIVLVSAAAVGLRVWWLNRKFGRASRHAGSGSPRRNSVQIIEGEYRVVRRDRDET